MKRRAWVRLSRSAARLTITAVIAALLSATATQVARADTHLRLDLEGFYDLAVDEAHGHAFVSQGRGTDRIVVTDLRGKRVGTIPGMGGARGLVFSEDGSRLFAGLSTDRAVAEIDTTTLQVVEVHPLPRWKVGSETFISCPADLVWYHDLILIGDACPRRPGALRVLDPSTGDVTASFYHPQANAHGRLAVSEPHDVLLSLYSDNVSAFDIATDPTPSFTFRGENFQLSQARDLAFLPGTKKFVVDTGEIIDIDTMAFTGAYGGSPNNAPTQPEPETVAVRADGIVAFGLHRFSRAGDVRTYAAPARLMRDHAFVSTDDPIFQDERLSFRARSLEFGKLRLYGIEFADRGTEARFWSIKPREDTTLDVSTRRRSYARHAMVTVAVRATGPLQSRRGIAWIERWDRNDQVSGRVRYQLNRRGVGSFEFRLRARSTVHVTLNDGGDLVMKNRIIGLRR